MHFLVHKYMDVGSARRYHFTIPIPIDCFVADVCVDLQFYKNILFSFPSDMI